MRLVTRKAKGVGMQAPEHWSQHTGPAQWYTVSFPSQWEHTELDGVLTLLAPREGGLLTIKCLWVDDVPADLEQLANVDGLFPRRRRVKRLQPLSLGEDSFSLSGEVGLRRGTGWRRIFARTQWRRWRLWCFRHQNVCILALYFQSGPYDPDAESLVGMILNTLTFADLLADPPERFARRVLELAQQKFPQLDCQSAPDFHLRLGDFKINLLDYYHAYVQSPQRFHELMAPALTTVVRVQGWNRDDADLPLELVRDRIMPMLYPESVWRERFPHFAASRWVAGLVVLYVVDESQVYWYIRDDLADRWGLSADELHDLALRNLDRYFDRSPMEFTLAGEDEGPQLLLPMRSDVYNSSRWLSETFQGKLRELLGAEFAVGVPSRDFFVAVSLASEVAVAQVRRRVLEDFRHMDHPLSDRMLLVSNDGVSEFSL